MNNFISANRKSFDTANNQFFSFTEAYFHILGNINQSINQKCFPYLLCVMMCQRIRKGAEECSGFWPGEAVNPPSREEQPRPGQGMLPQGGVESGGKIRGFNGVLKTRRWLWI